MGPSANKINFPNEPSEGSWGVKPQMGGGTEDPRVQGNSKTKVKPQAKFQSKWKIGDAGGPTPISKEDSCKTCPAPEKKKRRKKPGQDERGDYPLSDTPNGGER